MEEDDELTGYEELFKRLCATTTNPDGVAIRLFTTTDEDVVTGAVLSDEDIVPMHCLQKIIMHFLQKSKKYERNLYEFLTVSVPSFYDA